MKLEVDLSLELPRSSLHTILREASYVNFIARGRSLLPVSECVQLHEEALFIWLRQARSMNVPISGPIIEVKAKELALKLGHRDFSCT